MLSELISVNLFYYFVQTNKVYQQITPISKEQNKTQTADQQIGNQHLMISRFHTQNFNSKERHWTEQSPQQQQTQHHQSTTAKDPRLRRVRQQLLHLFVFYSSFADRDNYRLLKIQNFRRMLTDSQIATTQHHSKNLDILYCQANKSKTGLNFDEFVKFLPRIAIHVCKDQMRLNLSPKDALRKIMDQHLLVLQQYIMDKTEFGEDLNNISKEYSSKTFQVLLCVKPVLERIYKDYFPHEAVVSKQNPKKSLEALFEFLRQFELTPSVVSKSLVYIMYQRLLEDQMQHALEQRFSSLQLAHAGKQFTFKRFVKALICIGLVGFKRLTFVAEGERVSEARKVSKLLERMEVSMGMQMLQKSVQTTQLSKTSLLISQDTLEAIETGEMHYNYSSHKKVDRSRSEYVSGSIEKGTPKSTSKNLRNFNFSSSSPSRKLYSLKDFSEQQLVTMEKHGQALRTKFEKYCGYGDTLNSTTLKSIKISKILKQIGVLNILGQSQLDLIISNLCRSSESGKIEYPQFIRLLYEISLRIASPLDKLVVCLLAHEGENGEYSLSNNNILSNKSLIRGQPRDVYTLLREIEKPLRIYFDHYSPNKSTMNFAQYSKFMYDFEVFPFLVSKPRLFQLFNQAVPFAAPASTKSAHSSSSANLNTSLTSKYASVVEKAIDFEMFRETLGICALEIQQTKLTHLQKLLLLLERMNDSKGPKIVIKLSGNTRNSYGIKVDFLSDLRRKYSAFYQKEIFGTKKKPQEEQDFDTLMLA